jgi:hypothetical protein
VSTSICALRGPGNQSLNSVLRAASMRSRRLFLHRRRSSVASLPDGMHVRVVLLVGGGAKTPGLVRLAVPLVRRARAQSDCHSALLVDFERFLNYHVAKRGQRYHFAIPSVRSQRSSAIKRSWPHGVSSRRSAGKPMMREHCREGHQEVYLCGVVEEPA